ncbi:biotin--[acetyl-CoA-carboxylase] ligase [Flavobacterium sp. 3HN19-14]|uniref:biotin--[acetyl-CoA-carboxylase] ligase n=1 Tax=Flavobacterium sp. 3HN19-14 TaxID=3448133 RepID=UPI003EDFE3DC
MQVTLNLENFTVVSAENQTKGKGQMGAKWVSEIGKNLIMSILIKDLLPDINQIYNLNVAVAVSIIEVLEDYKIPQLSVKWPNDIMAGNKKVGGILIENSIRSSGEIFSIVGIGLNVNQSNFEDLPKASSLSVATGISFDKEELLVKITERIEQNSALIFENQPEILWKRYLSFLFKKGIPMAFEITASGERIMGIITDVSADGKLLLKVEDDSIKSFGIKEIQMLY